MGSLDGMTLANIRISGAHATGRLRAQDPMRGMWRRVLLALMFIALGFLALHPLCELAFASHGAGVVAGFASPSGNPASGQPCHDEDPAATCCADVQDWTLVKPGEAFVSWTPGRTLGAVFFLFAGLPLFVRSRDAARWLRPAIPERSFYARSARILR